MSKEQIQNSKKLNKQANYQFTVYKRQVNQEFNFVSQFNSDAKGMIIFLSALMTLSVVAAANNQIKHHNSQNDSLNSSHNSVNKINNIQNEKMLQQNKEYNNFILSIVHPGTIVKSGNTYSINAQIQEESLIDKNNLEKAYDFSVKVFNNLFNAEKWNINKLVNETIKLNGYITGGKGKIRDGDMIVKKARDIDHPDLLNTSEMLRYLPDDNESREEYIHFANRYGELQSKNPGYSFTTYIQVILKSTIEDKAKKFISKYYDFYDATPEQIRHQIKELFKNLEVIKDPIEAAAYCAIDIAEIHAFADGNGRVARFLENVILQKAGINPVAHLDGQRYDRTVNDSIDKKDIRIYKKYLSDKIVESKKISDRELHIGDAIEKALTSCREGMNQLKKDCWSAVRELIEPSNEITEFSSNNVQQEDVILLANEKYADLL